MRDFLDLLQADARAFCKKKLDKKEWTFEQAFKAMQYWRNKNEPKDQVVTLDSAKEIFA